jgi:hypothetical protein
MTAEALRGLYADVWDRLFREVPHDQGVSSPLFIAVPERYRLAPLKLMVVGQETFSWYGPLAQERGDDPVGAIQASYAKFCLGKHYRASPFWQAVRKLERCLAPAVPPFGVVWSNLFPCDQRRRRPRGEVAERLLALGVLPREVQALQPDAVVFLTGPNYDWALSRLFLSVKHHPCGDAEVRSLSRVEHPGLPGASFRTYHPGYLWRKRKSGMIDVIAGLIKQHTGGAWRPVLAHAKNPRPHEPT